jgi:hypothetical protein
MKARKSFNSKAKLSAPKSSSMFLQTQPRLSRSSSALTLNRKERTEVENKGTFSLADLVALSMKSREAKARALADEGKLIEGETDAQT